MPLRKMDQTRIVVYGLTSEEKAALDTQARLCGVTVSAALAGLAQDWIASPRMREHRRISVEPTQEALLFGQILVQTLARAKGGAMLPLLNAELARLAQPSLAAAVVLALCEWARWKATTRPAPPAPAPTE